MPPVKLDAAYRLRDGRIVSTGAIHEIPDGIEYEDIAEVGHSDDKGNFYTRDQAKALRNPKPIIASPVSENYDITGPESTETGLMFKAVHKPSGQSVGFMTILAKPDKDGLHSISDSYLDSEHNHDFVKSKFLNHANNYLKKTGNKGLLVSEDIKKSILDPSAGYKITHEHHPDINMTTVRAHSSTGEVVGEVGFTHLPSGHLESETVKVHPDHQRRGIATALYNHAKAVTGKQIVPSSDQTPEGKLFSQSIMANLKKMALADIPKGIPKFQKQNGDTVHDYTHVLDPQHQKRGYSLHLEHGRSGSLHVVLGFNHHPVGFVTGMLNKDSVSLVQSEVDEDHKNKGLGTSAYEAFLAHAYHNGARNVIGGVHSTLASRVHKKLATKHGMEYQAKPSGENRSGPTGNYDNKRGEYGYLLRSELQKSGSGGFHSDQTTEGIPASIIKDAQMMIGEPYLNSQEFEAAKFMVGNIELDDEKLNQAKLNWEGNVLNMALAAYGLEINDKNKKILGDIIKISDLNKHFESAIIPRIVKPYSQIDTVVSDFVQEAYSKNDVHVIKLNGRHSKGAAILEGGGNFWLLKPGSGKLSSARGLNEEKASSSRREVAFNKIANLIGLGQFFPEAALVTLDGTEVAALEFFNNMKSFDSVKKDFEVVNLLNKYAQSGLLFKWATIDFVLGQTDRHSGNLLVDEKLNFKFIDAGSAFSGPSFNPASDVKSWVPIYLRVYGPYKFNQLSPKQKFDSIPAPSREGDLDLTRWVSSINEREITEILNNYEINPQPVLNRIKMLKDYNGPKSEFLRKFYSNLIPSGVLN